ncbi:40S ribosomal protein S4 [Neolecta irregularis DAH-3]|uniref:40S ribosomal protein S4 n=1 Tax=Neolecta irregularis (strain DAH-3) TaxID=1198029 RepID=A0A1U7LHE5_NEOID|nr:40S ribosomal protein S4 [Neolecta irregularis DAH-3]|eukprot:OLL22080.1 40S ribosomal protein S4 [Neolecta irregularis DAH-3]
MTRGVKKHLKRLAAPDHWLLDKLGGTYAPKSSSDPSSLPPTDPSSLPPTDPSSLPPTEPSPPSLPRTETSSSLYHDAALTDVVVSLPSVVYNSSDWSLSAVLATAPVVDLPESNVYDEFPPPPESLPLPLPLLLEPPQPPLEPLTPSASMVAELGSIHSDDHSLAEFKPDPTNQDIQDSRPTTNGSEIHESAFFPASESPDFGPIPPSPVGESSFQLDPSRISAALVSERVLVARLTPLPPYFSSGDIKELPITLERTNAYIDRALHMNCFDTGLHTWLLSMKPEIDALNDVHLHRPSTGRSTASRIHVAKDIAKIFGRKAAEVVHPRDAVERSNKSIGFFGLRKRRSSGQTVSSPPLANPTTPTSPNGIPTTAAHSSPLASPRDRNRTSSLFSHTPPGSANTDSKSRKPSFFTAQPDEYRRLNNFFGKKSTPQPSTTVPKNPANHRWGKTFDGEYTWSDPAETHPDGWNDKIERIKEILPHVETEKIVAALKEAEGDEVRAVGITILSVNKD